MRVVPPHGDGVWLVTVAAAAVVAKVEAVVGVDGGAAVEPERGSARGGGQRRPEGVVGRAGRRGRRSSPSGASGIRGLVVRHLLVRSDPAAVEPDGGEDEAGEDDDRDAHDDGHQQGVAVQLGV